MLNRAMFFISAGLACVAISSTARAQAEVNTGKGGLYFGVKALYSDIKTDGTENAGGVGLLIADHYKNGLGMEAEGSRTNADVNLLDLTEDYVLDTAGLYGVYRSPGALYAKIRGGLVWKRLSLGADSSTKTAFGGGVGVGYDFGKVLLEGEYTYIDRDIAQWGISVLGKF